MPRNRFSAFSLSFILALFCAASVSAGVFTVTKTTDTDDGVCNADCSLREAVAVAETDTGADPTNIVFSPALSGSTVTITGYVIWVAGVRPMNIIGLGADRLTISSNHQTMFVMASRAVKLTDMTITGGGYAGCGKGQFCTTILMWGNDLTFDRVHFTGNAGFWGPVRVESGYTLFILNSTFDNNTSERCGAVSLLGKMVIVNSTFTGNSGGNAGAICIDRGLVTMRNTTITSNTAGPDGAGGILADNPGPTALDIGNSIVAGNTGTYPEIRRIRSGAAGVVISAGGNHIGDSGGDAAATGNPVTWLPSDTTDVSPLLGTLQNNGGRTPTFMPLAGSPVIDMGLDPLAGLSFDQRGYKRFVNGGGGLHVDKGPVEFSSTPDVMKFTGRVRDSRGRAIPRARVVLSDMLGNKRKIFANSLGYYTFTGVATGESYSVTAVRAPFTFPLLVISENAPHLTNDILAQ